MFLFRHISSHLLKSELATQVKNTGLDTLDEKFSGKTTSEQ